MDERYEVHCTYLSLCNDTICASISFIDSGEALDFIRMLRSCSTVEQINLFEISKKGKRILYTYDV